MTDIALPRSNMYILGSGFDTNGNKIVKIEISGLQRAFSVQTCVALPKTNYILRGLKSKKDMETVSEADLEIISSEVVAYIVEYGSALQKEKLRTYEH